MVETATRIRFPAKGNGPGAALSGFPVLSCASALFFVSSVAIGFLGFPGGVPGLVAGILFAVAIIALEIKLHTIHPNALMGGIVGTSMGLVMAIGFGIGARQLDLSTTQEAVIQGVVLLALAYLGMIIGAIKGQHGEWWLPWKHFVDRGTSLKRARGRRGLDILRGLQEDSEADVVIDSIDFANVSEVDDKLLEFALKRHAPVMTNDFNLAKVAQVRGVEILNINELANALKPAFLPGETMPIFIVKDGKEPGQGVGYLDDGTMVVVDGARDDRGETVELVVTSVLQTSAGKMVFGKKPGPADALRPREAPAQASH